MAEEEDAKDCTAEAFGRLGTARRGGTNERKTRLSDEAVMNPMGSEAAEAEGALELEARDGAGAEAEGTEEDGTRPNSTASGTASSSSSSDSVLPVRRADTAAEDDEEAEEEAAAEGGGGEGGGEGERLRLRGSGESSSNNSITSAGRDAENEVDGGRDAMVTAGAAAVRPAQRSRTDTIGFRDGPG